MQGIVLGPGTLHNGPHSFSMAHPVNTIAGTDPLTRPREPFIVILETPTFLSSPHWCRKNEQMHGDSCFPVSISVSSRPFPLQTYQKSHGRPAMRESPMQASQYCSLPRSRYRFIHAPPSVPLSVLTPPGSSSRCLVRKSPDIAISIPVFYSTRDPGARCYI